MKLNKEVVMDGNTKNNEKIISHKYYRITLMVIFFCAVVLTYFLPQKSNTAKAERKFPVMGTFAHTVVYGSPELAAQAAAAIRDIFFKVEKTCNIFDPESELSRLNASASVKPFKCSPLLWSMFNSARRAYDTSGGAFDVSARPLMLLWGFYRKRGDTLPARAEIDKARTGVGLNKVIFDDKNRTVRFSQPGMSIDMGGIAKGAAVQLAAEKISSMGIRDGVIDLGGNMYCLGASPRSGKYYIIGVRDPLAHNRVCARLAMRDQAVATSGNYERYVSINGHHYTHIMNPETGMPVEDMLSVTVICGDAGKADFLSTSVFINGAAFAERICKTNPDTGIFIVRRNPDDRSRTETRKFGNLKILAEK
ncbi:MAG: FAD:protein FMN transferase [Victivallaceae bacterium]|nr:FAD:protein FMN transferase [Victivallaceae bacterium]